MKTFETYSNSASIEAINDTNVISGKFPPEKIWLNETHEPVELKVGEYYHGIVRESDGKFKVVKHFNKTGVTEMVTLLTESEKDMVGIANLILFHTKFLEQWKAA